LDADWAQLDPDFKASEERKFLEALMRLTRGDVRNHILSFKIDHGPS
jgi:hypothetical protein